MGRFLDLLLRLVCGGSRVEQEPPEQSQYPVAQPQRPAAQPEPVRQQDDGFQPAQPQHKKHHKQHHEKHEEPAPAPVHEPAPRKEHSPSPPRHQEGRPHGYVDQNQANQHDARYMALRAEANEEGDKMARAFSESHAAYAAGDGARAKELSNEGKAHQARMEELNGQASDWIFVENNKDSQPGEIDLHGLYVKEAISHTDRSIQEARQRGESELHLITGKGLHSKGGVAKLKPAIEELMAKHQLVAEMDPHNAGVLIVHLDGRGAGQPGAIGTDEIAGRLERGDDQCIIM